MFKIKKSKKTIALTKEQLSIFYSSISSFIHSNRTISNDESLQINPLKLQQLPTSFSLLFYSQMLNSLNTFVNSNHLNDKPTQTLYSSLLYPKLTEKNHNNMFDIAMNDKLNDIFTQNSNRKCSSKKKISFSKCNTYFKKNSDQKDASTSKGQNKSISLINDHFSSDDVIHCRNKDKDGVDSVIFDTKTYDNMSIKNTHLSIKPIEEEYNHTKISTKGNILNQKISRTTLFNKSNKIRDEYSNQVRLTNMLNIPKEGMNQENIFKENYIKKYMDFYGGDKNDLDKHDYSIMNYLLENLTTYNYTKNKHGRNPKKNQRKVINNKNNFKFNLNAITDSPMPKTIRVKSNSLFLLRKNNDNKTIKIKDHHRHQKTQENNINFIELFNKYIDFDRSYDKKIIHHKKIYSQQKIPSHRNHLQIDYYNRNNIKDNKRKNINKYSYSRESQIHNGNRSQITNNDDFDVPIEYTNRSNNSNYLTSPSQRKELTNIKKTIKFAISKNNIIEYTHIKPD